MSGLRGEAHYTRDAAGKITQITATPNGGGAATVLSGATYHPFGGPKSWTFGNGQAYNRTIDLDGRISGFTLGGTAMTVTFDAAGRITGQTYFPTPASSVTYGYDTLDRLTSTVTPATTYGFGYDANSNRTTKTVGAGTKTYAYPGTNNKLSSVTGGGIWTYTHDANGSITNDNINTFTYDMRGRMTGATTGLGNVTYALNALGQRYAKTLSGTTTVYLYDMTGRLIAETSDSGATYTEYLWLQDTPVALIKPSSASLYYIHTDHLDTPRLIANQTPVPVWTWDNDDPFAANMANPNPSGLGTFTFTLRLPGQFLDPETNYHYNYFRDYSTELGRYVESDPVGLRSGLNTYAYVGGSPLQWTDPYGLESKGFSTRYGNWCGRNWSGGRQGFKIPQNPTAPSDSLDECCMAHDYCYAKVECLSCASGSVDKTTKTQCDSVLVDCLDALGGKAPRNWPKPPPPGQETDAYFFCQKAKWWFK